MKRRLLLVAAAIGIAAAVVPAAWADGNVSTGSVGSAQVGSTGSSPSVDATTPLGTLTVAFPADIAGSGGNMAQQSVGTAQVGGGNSARRSAGTAQVSAAHGAPHATADAHVVRADAGVSGAVPGDGANTATRSVGTIQAGGGHSTDGSVVQPQVSPSSFGTQASVDLGELGSAQFGLPGLPLFSGSSGSPALAYRLGLERVSDYSFDPGSALLQVRTLGLLPDLYAALDPVAALAIGGFVGTGPNGGNTAADSFGTGQVGSVTVAPTVSLDSPALESSATVGGGSGVDGAGTNVTGGDSLGTLQAGGGNTVDRSAGTMQIGGLVLAPAGKVVTPYGMFSLGGSSGIAGGSSSATRSLGTLQIGGGNNADRSAGTVQVGQTVVAPTLAAIGTPVGDASLGGSSSIMGSGNDATRSIGTVQIGGGNVSIGSGGAGQSSGIAVNPTVTATGTPAGDESVGSPTNVGEGNGNTSTGSLGTAQVGGGNTATNSILALQSGSQPQPTGGPTASTLSSDRSGSETSLPTPAGTSSSPAAPAASTTPTASAAPATHNGVLKSSKTLVGRRATGTLPFTGIDLFLVVVLGSLLLAGGRRLRASGMRR